MKQPGIREASEDFMKFMDFSQWVTTALAATAILAFPDVSALAVFGVSGAVDTYSSTTSDPQAIDRAERVPDARGIVLADEEDTDYDDTGQPPGMNDPGMSNPPDTEDGDYDEEYYAGVDSRIVYGPGWYGPGWWYGPNGWFFAPAWWYAPAWWFSTGFVWGGGLGQFDHRRHFHGPDRAGFHGRFDGHDRTGDHGRFGGHGRSGGNGRFGEHGGSRGGTGGRR